MVCFFSVRSLWLQFHEIVFRFCVPMDNDRPSLDLQLFHDICPDKNSMSKMQLYELGLTWPMGEFSKSL